MKPSKRIMELSYEVLSERPDLSGGEAIAFATMRYLDEQREQQDLWKLNAENAAADRDRLLRAHPQREQEHKGAYRALYTIGALARSTVGTAADDGETLIRIEDLAEQVLKGADYGRICEVAEDAERRVQEQIDEAETREAEALAESTRKWRAARDEEKLRRSAECDTPPEGAMHRAADALGVDLHADRTAAFGETSDQMRRWIESNRKWDSALVNTVRKWEESVALLEADASRYQDVCDALEAGGRPLDHAGGEDAHQVVEQLLLDANPDASEYAKGFEEGQDYARETAEMEQHEREWREVSAAIETLRNLLDDWGRMTPSRAKRGIETTRAELTGDDE